MNSTSCSSPSASALLDDGEQQFSAGKLYTLVAGKSRLLSSKIDLF